MITPPVRTGDLHQLEGGADIGGGPHVRPATQIYPVPLAVQSDGFRRRQVLNELGLVFLALRLEEGDGFLAVDHAALEPGAAADNVAHFRLDGGEVVRRERLIACEIVVEAVLDRWADGDLRAGIKILHRFGQHVSGVVTDHFQRFRVAARDEHQRRVAVYRGREIDRPAIQLHRQGGPSETWTDRGCHVGTRDRRIELAHGTVGQSNGRHGSMILMVCEAASMASTIGWSKGAGPQQNAKFSMSIAPRALSAMRSRWRERHPGHR